MSISYDQPSSREVLSESLSETFDSDTLLSVNDLLGEGDEGVSESVVVGAWDGSSEVQQPEGLETQLVVVSIPEQAEPVNLIIPPSASTNPVWIFDTDADVNVNFNTVPRVIINGRGSDNFTVAGDANTTIVSAGGNDTLTTSGGNDAITIQAGGDSSVSTGAGNDTIKAGTGNDTIDAGSGLDIVEFANPVIGHTGSVNNGVITIANADGTSNLLGVERVHFGDKKFALDLQEGQNGAMSLQIINVLAGEARKDPAAVGVILELFDSGYTLESLAQYALDVGWVTQLAGSTSNEDLAKTVWKNIFGTEANEAELDLALSYMDGRVASLSQAQFIATTAQLDANNDAIDLVGLQQSAIEYLV